MKWQKRLVGYKRLFLKKICVCFVDYKNRAYKKSISISRQRINSSEILFQSFPLLHTLFSLLFPSVRNGSWYWTTEKGGKGKEGAASVQGKEEEDNKTVLRKGKTVPSLSLLRSQRAGVWNQTTTVRPDHRNPPPPFTLVSCLFS